MRKLLFATALSMGALVGTANAVEFTLSKDLTLPASGTFGTFTTTLLADGTTLHVDINMDPNYIIDTGNGHMALTLSLLGAGRIVESSFNLVNGVDVYTAALHNTSAPYSNSPFGDFTDAVVGACGNGASDLFCGQTMSFNISNFEGFGAATNLFDPPPPGGQTFQVYAAMDIFMPAPCTGGCTGAVALGGTVTVPGPIAGAGIPGLVAALGGIFGLNFYRRRRNNSHLPA
jgi:hypothetical protein